MATWPGRRTCGYVFQLLLTTVAYFLAGKVGLSLSYGAEEVSTVWPPTGLALAAVILLGYRIWPAIALGAFWVNATTSHEPPMVALAIACGNTLEALVGAGLMRRVAGFTPSLERLKDVVALILFGALVGTAISATVGTTSLCLGRVHSWARWGDLWRVWWLGDATGALIVTPALLTWSTWRRDVWSARGAAEAGALAVAMAGVALVVFTGALPSVTTDFPLEYAVFPLVIWAALRTGVRGAASVTFAISAVAIWGAIHGLGPFSRVPLIHGMVLLQLFMGIVALTSLLLAAAAAERTRIQEQLLLDVTQRKYAEVELRDANRRKDELLASLQESTRRKDDFLAMLSHELRNPLAPIRNAVHILKLVPTADLQIQQCRDLIDRQVRHLSRLVDDLLDVSRISRGKIRLRRERIDLGRLVRTTAEDRCATLRQLGLTLELTVPECPVWVEGDATRLAQALGNLLDNSAKFTDAGGRVCVYLETDAENQQAVVTVRDTGIGIEPEILTHIFDVFAQGDRSLERSRGGLGLGLALVKGLIEMHGGTASAASAGAGQGSTFALRLPALPEPPALSHVLTRPPPEGKAHLRVLVVDDNRDAAESLRLLLEMFGHQVQVAGTGPEGVELAHIWVPDVVLCDIGLPGLNGYEVADRLRGDPITAGARLIAVTGYGQEEDMRRSQRAGFDAHLVKPVDPETLEPLLGVPKVAR